MPLIFLSSMDNLYSFDNIGLLLCSYIYLFSLFALMVWYACDVSDTGMHLNLK